MYSRTLPSTCRKRLVKNECCLREDAAGKRIVTGTATRQSVTIKGAVLALELPLGRPGECDPAWLDVDVIRSP
jgi:hypothetical protein